MQHFKIKAHSDSKEFVISYDRNLPNNGLKIEYLKER
jgi:hypothetical protein